ncbi:phospholipase D-like domain-containing protein [Pararhizobium sp. IMCC21322]|uniref:phospholipase D family protein n=1 Tax=Pararhizobium sp. IMCC21322 TaxID=3067903 RepID=UPI002740A47A|nr:phospholipase D-like domain-containing protein [Pararhizobium sp. IMCC21322]
MKLQQTFAAPSSETDSYLRLNHTDCPIRADAGRMYGTQAWNMVMDAAPASKVADILITAAEAYPAMERLILGAHSHICLSLHALSFSTPVKSKEAQSAGLCTWLDLLSHAAHRHVDIYLLLTDFDPVGAHELHEEVWSRTDVLLEHLSTLPHPVAKRFHLQVSFPGGRAGSMLQHGFWPFVRHKAADLLDGRDIGTRLPPGLAVLAGRNGRVRLAPSKPLYSQSFHQKFLIADHKAAMIGGLDVDPRRFDDPAHDRTAEETWHDVDLHIEGPVVSELLAHFQFSWSTARNFGFSFLPHYLEQHYPDLGFLTDPNSLDSDSLDPDSLDPGSLDLASSQEMADTSQAGAQIKLVTTSGRNAPGLLSWGAELPVTDLEQAHLDMIGSARQQIYLESQFLRSRTIVEALSEAGRKTPSLKLIALLPAAPEDVAFGGGTSSVHRFGEWLQIKALERLKTGFGDRFGVFCLTNDVRQTKDQDRDSLYGHSMVYIHSKVMLIDDAVGLVSSANLNGRSMRFDFEAGVLINSAEDVGLLRRRLWAAHFSATHDSLIQELSLDDGLSFWRQKAAERAALGDQAKGVGVVPFPARKTRRFSLPNPFLSENLV